MPIRSGPLITRSPIIGSPWVLAVTLLAAFVSLLPIGLSVTDTGFISHLALAPIFAASIAERGRIGPVGAFAAGLIVDALTLTPLGLCAAAYLAFQGVTMREREFLREVPVLLRWLFFGVLAGAVAALHISAMVLVAGVEPIHLEVGISLAVTCLAYPVVSSLAGLARRPRAEWRRQLRS